MPDALTNCSTMKNIMVDVPMRPTKLVCQEK